MFKKILSTIALTITVCIFNPSPARAVIAWDWVFTNNNLSFGSTDIVTSLGRLYNNSTDNETIGSFASGATAYIQSVSVQIVFGYNADIGPTINGSSIDFFNQFNTPILPGNFKDFTFSTFSPTIVIPDGYYASFEDKIALSLRANDSPLGEIANCFSWNIGDSNTDGCNPNTGGPVVPEPFSLALLASGLAATYLRRNQLS